MKPAPREDPAKPAATASKPVTPITGAPVACAIPRAAASPIRMPVKLPGPTVTAIMSSAEAGNPALCMTESTIGSSFSAWPCIAVSNPAASTVSPEATTTEQPNPAESSARTTGSLGAPVSFPLWSSRCSSLGIRFASSRLASSPRFILLAPRSPRGCSDEACSRCLPLGLPSSSDTPNMNPACGDRPHRPRSREK